MRTLTRLMTVAVVLLALVVPAGPAPASPAQTARYVTGTPDPLVAAVTTWVTGEDIRVQCAPNALAPGTGGACFVVPSGMRSAGVTVSDASGRTVSGTLWFEDEGNRSLMSMRFCLDARVDVPSDARRAVVAVDTTIIGCGPLDGGPATAGKVSLVLEP